MSIFFESVANSSGAGSGTTVTNSLTVTSAGTNNVAVLFTSSGDAAHDVHTTGVTWDGVAMTQVGTIGTGGVNGTLMMWILVNPSIGTKDLVTTWNSSVTSFGAYNSLAIFSGCSATQPDASTNPTGVAGTFTVNVTTVAANAMVVLMTNYGGTAGTNTTQIQAAIGWSGYRLATTAGSYGVSEVTTAGAGQAIAGALSLAPFAAAAATGPRKLALLGVG